MNLQKLIEDLIGIKRPMGLGALQARGFKNTYETKRNSRIQIFRNDNYVIIYDIKEGEVLLTYREKEL